MIKLKMTSREMQALSRFCQISIEIARYEITNGVEIVVRKFDDSCIIKPIAWPKEERSQNILNIADRNAHIDEFERMQRKLLISYDIKTERTKTIQITKSSGNFLLKYMPKVEHGSYIVTNKTSGMHYVNIVAQTQANVILKNLI